jgi:uncharacterized phage infection (PIP) family protein YhgE
MTKVLFLLSAVVMVVAGFFSYQNRDTFIQARKERTESVRQIKLEMKKVADINTEIGTVRDQITGVNTEVTNATELLTVAKSQLKNAEEDSKRFEKEIQASTDKLNEYKSKITKLPEGMTIETMSEGINKLKQSIADKEGEVTKMQEQVAAKEAEVKKSQSRLDAVIEKIESRKKLFERNSMTARIVAVNNDWGFVVIDGGQNKGITVDTKLLITRGTDTIGRLNIIGVDGNKTVANIDQKSLRPGLAVAPGDHVILETLYQ